MPARLAAASAHAMTLEEDAGTGGALTNSGARTAGGLENIGTATSNTFTMTEAVVQFLALSMDWKPQLDHSSKSRVFQYHHHIKESLYHFLIHLLVLRIHLILQFVQT